MNLLLYRAAMLAAVVSFSLPAMDIYGFNRTIRAVGGSENTIPARSKVTGPNAEWCPGRGSNPHGGFPPRDFKSLASADFATRASGGQGPASTDNYSGCGPRAGREWAYPAGVRKRRRGLLGKGVGWGWGAGRACIPKQSRLPRGCISGSTTPGRCVYFRKRHPKNS